MGNVNDTVTVTTQSILQGAGKITADGVDLGSFEGGVRVTWTETEKFVNSEYYMGDLKGEIDKVDVMVETTLEQASMINLAIALGLNSSSVVSAASSSSTTLDLTPVKSMREVQLVFKGMSAENNDLARTFTVERAVRVGTTAMPLQRGTKTVLPVQFKCLLNSSGSFGSVVENGKGTLS